MIHIEPGSEIDQLLDDVADTPVELEKNGVLFHLERVATPTRRQLTPAEVQRSIEGIRSAAGVWDDIDPEALKAYIRERRRTANRASLR